MTLAKALEQAIQKLHPIRNASGTDFIYVGSFEFDSGIYAYASQLLKNYQYIVSVRRVNRVNKDGTCGNNFANREYYFKYNEDNNSLTLVSEKEAVWDDYKDNLK
jgi:hypothetical protein